MDLTVFLELPEGETALACTLMIAQVGYLLSDVSLTKILDHDSVPSCPWAKDSLDTEHVKEAVTLKVSINLSIPLLKMTQTNL